MTSSKQGNVFAVYDMSSSSVAGGHVLATHGTNNTVFLAAARKNAPLQEDMDMQRFVEDTCKQLHEVITTIRKQDLHQPSYIQVTLASPWYTSQTRTISYQKELPFTCTQSLVDSLIDAEIKHILANEEGSFGAFGKESIIVEKQLSGITLNGYATTAPFGKEATTLELYLTITIAPKPILDRFKDVIKREYGTRRIGFTTSPFTTFVVMRDRMDTNEDCVVIDVGEEVTDVAFIKGGIMRYQHSFPVGTYGLYRALADETTSTTAESMALLESYRLGKLSAHAKAKVAGAIQAFQTKWQTWFRQILDTGEYGFVMPSSCIVTADPRFESLLVTAVKNDAFIKHATARAPMTVMFMDQGTFDTHVLPAEGMPIDIPLATSALFVEQVLY